MDAKLVFWTLALVNLAVMVGCTLVGVRRIRAKDVRGHRRMMLTAASLVVLFLVAYGIKVVTLGHEDKSRWTSLDYTVLYVHETCIAVMLLAGGYAGYRALRFRRSLPEGDLPPAERRLADRRDHRRAGWAAAVASALAFVTAAGVLVRMYGRAIE